MLKLLTGPSALAAFVFATLGATPASAAEPMKVRLSWVPFAIQAPWYIGIEKGWFEAEGIDVDLEDGKGSSLTVNLVGAGNYDVGYANAGAMAIARDKAGMPIKSLMNPVRLPSIGLWVDKKSGIKTVRDAEKKGDFRITFTQGSFEGPFMNAFIKSGGGNVANFKLMNVEFQAKMSLYLAGESDGVVTSIPFFAPVLDVKKPSYAISFASVGLQIPDHGVIAHEDTIANKPKQLAAIVKVFSRAWDHMLKSDANAVEGIKIMMAMRPKQKATFDYIKAQWDNYLPLIDTVASKGKPAGWQAPEDWATAIKLLIDSGVVKPGAKPTDFYTNKFFDGMS